MAVNWTYEHTLAFAPDEQVTSSGMQLADPKKWQTLGRVGDTLWGVIKGSTRTPYQVTLALHLAKPAFKCTCPSRKQPCKHVVGLAFLFNDEPDALSESAPPPWTTDWLDEVERRQTRRQAKSKRTSKKKVVDKEAQAKRAAAREAKVSAGIEELEVWLRDLMHNGLASVESKAYDFWDGIARRMVDAQASGLAGRLRAMANIAGSGKNWPERLLERLGLLYLLVEAYKQIDDLSPDLQDEIRAQIGWTWKRNELLSLPDIRDVWVVVGRRIEDVDTNLRAQYTWLWGKITNKAALILDFSYGGKAFSFSRAPGDCIDAQLVYYPGAYPIRAIVKQAHSPTSLQPDESLPGYPTITEAIKAYAAALARTPWIDSFPMMLQQVRAVRYGNTWVLRDLADRRLLMVSHFDKKDHLGALSGGHPIDLFGEWDGDRLLPLGAWAEGCFTAL